MLSLRSPLLWAALWGLLGAAAPSDDRTVVSGLRIEEDGGNAVVKLTTTLPPTFTTHRSPTDFIVDLVDARAVGVPGQSAGAGLVKRVRFFDWGEGKLRFVLELASEDAEPVVRVHDGRMEIVVASGVAADLDGRVAAAEERVEEGDSLAAAGNSEEQETVQIVELPPELDAQLGDEPLPPPPAPLPPRVVSGAPPRPMARSGGTTTDLLQVGFRPTEAGGQVMLRLSQDASYRVLQEAGRLVLEIDNARIVRDNDRLALDTSYFPGPIARIRPVESRADRSVRIEVELRDEGVKHDVVQKEDALVLDISS